MDRLPQNAVNASNIFFELFTPDSDTASTHNWTSASGPGPLRYLFPNCQNNFSFRHKAKMWDLQQGWANNPFSFEESEVWFHCSCFPTVFEGCLLKHGSECGFMELGHCVSDSVGYAWESERGMNVSYMLCDLGFLKLIFTKRRTVCNRQKMTQL